MVQVRRVSPDPAVGAVVAAAAGSSPQLPPRRWKVYDVLWALSLLLLARRLKCVRKAQELLDL